MCVHRDPACRARCGQATSAFRSWGTTARSIPILGCDVRKVSCVPPVTGGSATVSLSHRSLAGPQSVMPDASIFHPLSLFKIIHVPGQQNDQAYRRCHQRVRRTAIHGILIWNNVLPVMLSPLLTHGDKMTYPNNNDPSMRNRRVDQVNYTPWIVGGAAALALILGVFFMTSDRTTSTASNVDRGTVTAPMNAPTVPSAPAPQSPATTGTGTGTGTGTAR